MIKLMEEFFTDDILWEKIIDARDGIVGFKARYLDRNIEIRFFKRWGGYNEIPRPVGPMSLMQTTHVNRFYIGIFENRDSGNYMTAFIKIDQFIMEIPDNESVDYKDFGYNEFSVLKKSNEVEVFEEHNTWSFRDFFESDVNTVINRNSKTEVHALRRAAVERQLFVYDYSGYLVEKKSEP